MPDYDQSVGPASDGSSKSKIIGAHGPLTAKQSKALLERIGTEAGDAGVLQRHFAIEQAVAESPLIAGNRTRIYSDLLEAGVKTYETHNLVLHSTTVVIDGVWSVIGSSNFDQRSVLFNDEVDAFVLGSETAQELEKLFEDDQRDAQEIDRQAWEDRPLTRKMKEIFSGVW